jgi:pteridine reductase
LVNNAAIYFPKIFSDINRDDLERMHQLNLVAPFFITQGLMKNICSSNNKSVINIIDALWDRPRPKYAHYSITKGGLAILTKALAVELAPNIRVNAVAPGAILLKDGHGESFRKKIIEKIPMGFLGDCSEIGEAVCYLAKSKYVTGQIISVDGGMSISPLSDTALYPCISSTTSLPSSSIPLPAISPGFTHILSTRSGWL